MTWTHDDIPLQTGKVAIVTGANSGIGFETARELARRGARVILACRSQARGEDALKRIQLEQPEAELRLELLDLSSLESVGDFAERILASEAQLDLLINNAGVMMPKERELTSDGFELQFGVNHLGHFALTAKLLPLLDATPGARIVSVASQAHRAGKMNFDDPNWSDRRYRRTAAYGQSKLANLLFTFELNRRLQEAGSKIKAVAAHPGWTATELQRHTPFFEKLNGYFAMTTSDGALPTLRAATDPEAVGGDYFGPNGFMEMRGKPVKVGSHKRAKRLEDAAELWTLSEDATGVELRLF